MRESHKCRNFSSTFNLCQGSKVFNRFWRWKKSTI